MICYKHKLMCIIINLPYENIKYINTTFELQLFNPVCDNYELGYRICMDFSHLLYGSYLHLCAQHD